VTPRGTVTSPAVGARGTRRPKSIALAVRVAVVGTLGLCAVVSAACGTTHSGATGSTTTATTSATGHRTGPSVAEIQRSSEVEVGGKQVPVPTEVAGHPISQTIDDGQQIIISAAGFLPARLFSTPDVAVTWTNLTDQPQQVIFDYLPVRSPVIAPGGSFSWTSASTQSIAYRTASGLHGVDTVNPPFG